jgi:hypothetical protein
MALMAILASGIRGAMPRQMTIMSLEEVLYQMEVRAGGDESKRAGHAGKTRS